MAVVRHKEAIHSGHFMVSDFEAEAEDEEDLPVPPPEEGCNIPRLMADAEGAAGNGGNITGSGCGAGGGSVIPDDGGECGPTLPLLPEPPRLPQKVIRHHSAQAIIDISLNKLFQSMSIAYRQKLTSPKWNRFRGLRLRWKDKIRLNNVIWRCWHMQFIKGRNRLLCAFANPLDLDNHNFPEGGTVLEGKYWKRKLQTITREYMKWRMYYKNHGNDGDEGEEMTDQQWDLIFQSPFQMLEGSKDDAALEALSPEEDIFVNALFSSLQFDTGSAIMSSTGGGGGGGGSNAVTASSSTSLSTFGVVPYAASSSSMMKHQKTTNSDFIQPCLAPLQPNLDDFFLELESSCQSGFSDWQLSKLLTSGQENGGVQQQQQQQQQPGYYQPQFPSQQASFVNGKSSNNNLGFQPSTSSSGIDLGHHQQQPLTNTVVASPSTSSSSSSSSPVVAMEQDSSPSQQYLLQQQLNSGGGGGYIVGGGGLHQDLFPYPSQQKRSHTGPITCTSEKRHSLKHKILHHRDCSDVISEDSAVGSTAGGGGGGQQSSPYKVPSTTSAQSFLLEPRVVKSRNYSGPSDVLQVLGDSSSPHSELVQLLRSGKGSSFAKHDQAASSEPLHFMSSGRMPSIPPPPPSSSSSQVIIPPPPATSAPQPRIELTPPPQPMTSSISRTPELHSPNRRNVHISSEQKRRGSIKNGFDLMRSLIPSLSQSTSAKISKAALLLKGGDYLQQLKGDRVRLTEDIAAHRAEVERLNAEIAALQSSMACGSGGLGGGGIGGSVCLLTASDTARQMEALFDEHVERCTMMNWKYWVFSLVVRPLLPSFQTAVKAGSFEEMARTTANWIDQHLSLVQLRPMVLQSLKGLSTRTDVLTEPDRLPEEAVRAAVTDRRLVKEGGVGKDAEEEESEDPMYL